MKIGDLVMWIGRDSDHGLIGVVSNISNPELNTFNQTTYDVLWADGTKGIELIDCEIMALDNDP
jgi:hypothetical protein